jgi:hypothetical protein
MQKKTWLRDGRWEGVTIKNVAAVGSKTVGPDSKCALEQKNRLSIKYVALKERTC